MRIAVVGAGAIGGFIAGALARSGAEVGVVARGAHLQAIRQNGLQVRSELGAFVVNVPASSSLQELEREFPDGAGFEYLLLTFKAHQWPGMLPQLALYADTAATLVTLQNGVPFWFSRNPPLQTVDPGGKIGGLFPDTQIIGGVVHASGNIAAPGIIEQSRGMRYPLGELDGTISPRLQALHAAFQKAGLQSEIDDNIRRTLWIKLLNNTGQNPVSALTRKSIAQMFGDPPTRAWVRELMAETLAVGQAIGVVDEVDIEARIAYAARLSDVKTSMLQDLEAGRPLELDPILGATIELGERYNVAMPRLREAYDALKQQAAAT